MLQALLHIQAKYGFSETCHVPVQGSDPLDVHWSHGSGDRLQAHCQWAQLSGSAPQSARQQGATHPEPESQSPWWCCFLAARHAIRPKGLWGQCGIGCWAHGNVFGWECMLCMHMSCDCGNAVPIAKLNDCFSCSCAQSFGISLKWYACLKVMHSVPSNTWHTLLISNGWCLVHVTNMHCCCRCCARHDQW